LDQQHAPQPALIMDQSGSFRLGHRPIFLEEQIFHTDLSIDLFPATGFGTDIEEQNENMNTTKPVHRDIQRNFGRTRRIIRRAFTLTEMLIIISIIAILIGLLFPAAAAVRQAARQAHCQSNLKQLMLATLNYESKGGGFPPGDDGRGQSFMVSLLPFLEQDALWEQSKDRLEPSESYLDRWSKLSRHQLPHVICPAATPENHEATLIGQGKFASHYYGIAGPVGSAWNLDRTQQYTYRDLGPNPAGLIAIQGIFSPRENGTFASTRMQQVSDGISNTFALGEISEFQTTNETEPPKRSGWAFGARYDASKRVTKLYSVKSINHSVSAVVETLYDTPIASNHLDSVHFAMVDGSVQNVSKHILLDVLKSFSSINEGEALRGFDEEY